MFGGLLRRIATLDQARETIELIKQQGEGNGGSPRDSGPDDLSHYYRFAELFHGNRLRRDRASGRWNFDGPPVHFPEVWPMADVPKGGWPRAQVAPEVARLLDQFDTSLWEILSRLEAAWANGSGEMLADAVALMTRSLAPTAVALLQIEVPDSHETYGPAFARPSGTALGEGR